MTRRQNATRAQTKSSKGKVVRPPPAPTTATVTVRQQPVQPTPPAAPPAPQSSKKKKSTWGKIVDGASKALKWAKDHGVIETIASLSTVLLLDHSANLPKSSRRHYAPGVYVAKIGSDQPIPAGTILMEALISPHMCRLPRNSLTQKAEVYTYVSFDDAYIVYKGSESDLVGGSIGMFIIPDSNRAVSGQLDEATVGLVEEYGGIEIKLNAEGRIRIPAPAQPVVTNSQSSGDLMHNNFGRLYVIAYSTIPAGAVLGDVKLQVNDLRWAEENNPMINTVMYSPYNVWNMGWTTVAEGYNYEWADIDWDATSGNFLGSSSDWLISLADPAQIALTPGVYQMAFNAYSSVGLDATLPNFATRPTALRYEIAIEPHGALSNGIGTSLLLPPWTPSNAVSPTLVHVWSTSISWIVLVPDPDPFDLAPGVTHLPVSAKVRMYIDGPNYHVPANNDEPNILNICGSISRLGDAPPRLTLGAAQKGLTLPPPVAVSEPVKETQNTSVGTPTLGPRRHSRMFL